MEFGASHHNKNRPLPRRDGNYSHPEQAPFPLLPLERAQLLIEQINKAANARLSRFEQPLLGKDEIQTFVRHIVRAGITETGAKALTSLVRPYAASTQTLHSFFDVAMRFQMHLPTEHEWKQFRQALSWKRLPEGHVLERHIGALKSFVFSVEGKEEIERGLVMCSQGATKRGRFERFYRVAGELFHEQAHNSDSFQLGEDLYDFYRRSNCPPSMIGDIVAARAKSDVAEFDRCGSKLLHLIDEGYSATRVVSFFNGYGTLLADNKPGTADFVLETLEHSLNVGTPPRKVFERLMFGLCSGTQEEAFWERKDTVFRDVVNELRNEGVPIDLLSQQVVRQFVAYDRMGVSPQKEELISSSLAVVKAFSNLLIRDQNEFYSDSEVASLQKELNMLFSRDRLRYVIHRPQNLEKLMLILDGKGLSESDATLSPERLSRELTELYTHAVLIDVLYDPSAERRKVARDFFMRVDVANGDNPPFSLDKTPVEVQERFQGQTEQVMYRAFDGYYGFAALTYPFRRTPVSGMCMMDEMANALSLKLNVVHADDIHRFPGRGRYIEGIVPERVFFGAQGEQTLDHWKEHILPHYGPVAGGTQAGDVHALDDLVNTKFFFTRGAVACLCPDNPFHKILGTHYSYLFFNHHFDAQGVRTAFLVPTQVLLDIIEPTLEHYNPVVESYPTGKFSSDINETPPLLRRIRAMCFEAGAPDPIDLGWGSNYGGGLCNGFVPHTAPLHEWENSRDYLYWDAFGHAHKWNIAKHSFMLERLHDAHEKVWQVTTSLQNRLDLFKIAELQYLRGNTLDRKLGEEERRIEPGRGQRIDVDELRNMDEEDRELQARQMMENTHRMLEWVCRWSFECREKDVPREMRPVFVLQPVLHWAAPPTSPIVIDTANRLIWHKDGTPEFYEDEGGVPSEQTREVWNNVVYPHLARDPWLTGRFHFRDDFLPQMREYGAKE